MSNSEVLVNVENVSKKFCRRLRRSLWYGMKDLGAELIGRGNSQRQLRKDEFWAVKDVSLELQRGDTLGLIGRNGAGKTTLLRMLNGLIKPDGGRIEVRGRMQALVALGAGFNPILTGRENIYVNASILGLKKREIDAKLDEIIEFSDLAEFIDTPVQSYSSGMTVRLGFSVAACLAPDILLLDEVLAVGDTVFRAKCLNRIAGMRRNGIGTILVSHQMQDILRFSTKAIFLDKGLLKMAGDPESVVEKYNYEVATSKTSDQTKRNSDVAGSGRVKITDLSICSTVGQTVSSIKTGETVYLNIGYVKTDPEVKELVVDFKIRDRDGVLVQWTSEFSKVRFDKIENAGIIIIKLESLRSNTDLLVFFMTIWNHDHTELFDWKREMTLLVEGENRSIGRYIPKITWNHRIVS